MFRAQATHRANHDPNAVQRATLLSIKTGACPEDCAYCPQSVRYDTGLERETLVPLDEVRTRAQAAKDAGATRFCMGAAWRSPKKRDVEAVAAMIREVRALGMETCATLGMLTPEQAHELKDAGLDYYNHNVDTSPEFYGEIITTRTYQDRLTRWPRCATPDSMSAAAASSAWAKPRVIAPRCSRRSPIFRSIPRACPSTSWCACRVRRSQDSKKSIPSTSCARLPSRAS
jgi:hypothetical protein